MPVNIGAGIAIVSILAAEHSPELAGACIFISDYAHSKFKVPHVRDPDRPGRSLVVATGSHDIRYS